MKVVYIAHPIRGNVEGNLRSVAIIARRINLQQTDIVPLAPYFLDCCSLDDNIIEERERGIKNNTVLFKKGFIDELWLYGSKITSGMKQEIKLALELGIKVKPMTEGTEKNYKVIIGKPKFPKDRSTKNMEG